ncbi:unnamed protein product [Protopolystoma xenopodis]|uniref:non-specific protein-tyrosine kinase n=1 Tax=Protopolystoma xenopodis TaxID=117903 RepID=A0A448WCH7_9PLAT|nr:unnamed protein product [Protopolystoma xenopodis]
MIRAVHQLKYVEDSDLDEMRMSRPEKRRLRKYFERECPQTAMGKLKKRLARSTTNWAFNIPGSLSIRSPNGGHLDDSPSGSNLEFDDMCSTASLGSVELLDRFCMDRQRYKEEAFSATGRQNRERNGGQIFASRRSGKGSLVSRLREASLPPPCIGTFATPPSTYISVTTTSGPDASGLGYRAIPASRIETTSYLGEGEFGSVFQVRVKINICCPIFYMN